MVKIAEWIIVGIAILLAVAWVVLLVGDADRAAMHWISGTFSVLGLVAGFLHQRKKREEAKPPAWIKSAEAAPQRELSSTAGSATSVGAGGDPLGRWWRRVE